VLEPTIQSVLASEYDMKKVILVIAYEERGGPATKQIVEDLVEEYGSQFYHAMSVQHPADIPGEIIGKGGNITFAGRELMKYVNGKKLKPLNLLVSGQKVFRCTLIYVLSEPGSASHLLSANFNLY
jgi:predicted RNA-binding protein YlqC (UPF0109 family)